VNESLAIDREGATSAIILQFKEGKPVEFPAEFVADIGEKAALTVLHHKDKVVKLFPVASEDINLLRIEIQEDPRSFKSNTQEGRVDSSPLQAAQLTHGLGKSYSPK
jgi:hypothetical protein